MENETLVETVTDSVNLPSCEVRGCCGEQPVSLQTPEEHQLQDKAQAALNTNKPLTQTEFKKLLRMYFTVRHGSVKGCGHKLDVNNDPRNHCEYCWFAYFNTNGQMAQTADECFTNEGEDVLVRIRGKKFVKYFKRFMSTLARFKREQEFLKQEKSDVSDNRETDRSIGGVPEHGGLPSGTGEPLADYKPTDEGPEQAV
jgi:hypothetical protein